MNQKIFAIYWTIIQKLEKYRLNIIQLDQDTWFEHGEFEIQSPKTNINGLETLPIDLKNLRMISNKRLEKIDTKLFTNFINLQYIDLNSCEIKSIDPNAFDTLLNLNYLNLSCETLKNLPEFLFKNLKNLKELNLFNCKSLKLKQNHFKGLENLEILNYGGQLLANIDLFEGLKELRLKSMKFNEFSINGLKTLNTLSLTDIQLNAKTSQDLFKDLKNLKDFRFYKSSQLKSEKKSIINLLQNLSSTIEIFHAYNNTFELLKSISIPFIRQVKQLKINFKSKIQSIDDYCIFSHQICPNLESVILVNEFEMEHEISEIFSSSNQFCLERPFQPRPHVKPIALISFSTVLGQMALGLPCFFSLEEFI